MICRTNENEERMFMERENNDEIEIDLLEVAGELWRHFWVIVLSMIVFGAAAFSYATFLITPLYHSEAKVYVNNSNLSVGSTSISLTDLNAAQSLVDTWWKMRILRRPACWSIRLLKYCRIISLILWTAVHRVSYSMRLYRQHHIHRTWPSSLLWVWPLVWC